MSSSEFLLTEVVTVTAVTKQALPLVLDVSGYDEVDALLQVVAASGTSPTMTIRLSTAMQAQSDDGWVDLVTFTTVSAKSNELKTKLRPLKYVRWEIADIGGTSPSFSFRISGMLRRF